MKKLLDYIIILRPQQFIKNLFIFFPIFFGLKIFDLDLLLKSFYAFIVFCISAGTVYIFNDIFDRKNDVLHSIKSKRPIAAKKISVRNGYLYFSFLMILSLLFAYIFSINMFYLILTYIVTNILYTIILKKIPLLDVFFVSSFYILRLFAGYYATGIHLSMWIIIMTFLLSLFLSFAKRRDDVIFFKKSNLKTRNTASLYNLDFLNQAMVITGSVTIVSYIMYTVSPEIIAKFHTDKLYISVVFVLFGILRYLQLELTDKPRGSPIKIFYKDHLIKICVAGWLYTLYIVLY